MKTFLALGALLSVAHAQHHFNYYTQPQQQPYTSTSLGPNEVLGNFFNGHVPPTVAQAQQQLSYSTVPAPQPQYQQNRFAVGQPQQQSQPQSNLPRQVHFFGNNYDFFRQFHADAPAQRPSFNVQHQPFRASPPAQQQQQFNAGRPQHFAVSPSPSPSSSPSFASPFFTSPFAASPAPTLPSAPKEQSQPHPQNSLFNTFPNPKFTYGNSAGLKVYTTETLKSEPVVVVGNLNPSPAPKEQGPSTTPTYITTEAPSTSSTVAPTTQALTVETVENFPVIVKNTGRSIASIGTRAPIIVRTRIITTTEAPAYAYVTKEERPQTTTTQAPTAPPTTTPAQRSLYNSNNLVPGQLYTNTNGAYQAYYIPGAQAHAAQAQIAAHAQGLEEIEPQIIEFKVPSKMVEVEQGFDPYSRPLSFDNFGPPEIRHFSPSPPVTSSPIAMIVSEVSSQSPVQVTKQLSDSGAEVIRVGPKGRLLKKRRKISRAHAQEAAPTTYRPAPAPSDDVDENVEPPKIYRSRFRTADQTTTTTEKASPAAAEDKQALIANRLKSLERQIRFNKNKQAAAKAAN